MTRRLLLIGAALALSWPGAARLTGANEQAHWPQWRGPFFNGMARGSAPVEWGDAKNIKWKAAIPGRGHSTPVVWGDRIYLTTAVPVGEPAGPTSSRHANGNAGAAQEHKFLVMALDRRTGRVVWERVARVATPHEGYHRTYGSFASSSPSTDGQHLYVSFGSRGIYCYDLNGKLIWQKDLGVRMQMRNQFGEGAAPTLDGNYLVVPFDQDVDSFVVTLDKRTGKELWRHRRDEVSAWSTPLVVEHGGRRQVIISATNRVRGYEIESGKIIWECGGLGLNVIPAPVYQDGIVYAMSGFRDPKLMAIRLGKTGDLTGTDAILWSQTRGTSYTPSPVLDGGKLYTLTENGMLSCFDARTGQPYYQQTRLPQVDNFKASPVGADGKLYIASENGVVTIVRMGEKFEVIASNTLDDQIFIASPVIVEGEIFLRSQNQLFCISDKK
jgi:outer membrane protein assembly factor BamB